MPADEMTEQLGVSLPERRSYKTVAGLMIDKFPHLPNIGGAIETMGWRFEVINIDGRRIDKVLARCSGDEPIKRPLSTDRCVSCPVDGCREREGDVEVSPR